MRLHVLVVTLLFNSAVVGSSVAGADVVVEDLADESDQVFESFATDSVHEACADLIDIELGMETQHPNPDGEPSYITYEPWLKDSLTVRVGSDSILVVVVGCPRGIHANVVLLSRTSAGDLLLVDRIDFRLPGMRARIVDSTLDLNGDENPEIQVYMDGGNRTAHCSFFSVSLAQLTPILLDGEYSHFGFGGDIGIVTVPYDATLGYGQIKQVDFAASYGQTAEIATIYRVVQNRATRTDGDIE